MFHESLATLPLPLSSTFLLPLLHMYVECSKWNFQPRLQPKHGFKVQIHLSIPQQEKTLVCWPSLGTISPAVEAPTPRQTYRRRECFLCVEKYNFIHSVITWNEHSTGQMKGPMCWWILPEESRPLLPHQSTVHKRAVAYASTQPKVYAKKWSTWRKRLLCAKVASETSDTLYRICFFRSDDCPVFRSFVVAKMGQLSCWCDFFGTGCRDASLSC